ncbi:SDR family NAD(P)-dependent oxidoreductase [Flavihumibacter petaseus]|uniref:Putative 3-oxoacyl-[acyl-carrier-protein] reductase n=1 Tax=Flavihumibacter petaseus NBRC 106054 TaxID=1220578 RepID=A0A0E9N4N7_9BACT|nr:SDR family oxidoreductase [Flavihumibacter petaseus]GAO44636.1 putative 3-oxoacyl-[acyl-carrier-protein] reductase [Flavihumibacter petaseus NBRC 106054]
MSTGNRKVAIVTGGASGIGLAIARKFADNGIFTVVLGRDENKLAAARELLGANGTTISYDLSQLSGIPALIDQIHQEYGSIDILVNNAGINQKKPFTEVTDEEFQRVITTNLTAVFSISREVVKKMLPQGGGSIIHISSMAAYYGLPKVIGYSASKTAIEGLTRAMATELSAQGIRVNAIAPGFIVTDMTDKALNADPERKAKAMGRTAIGYMGKPEDIAETAFFLVSPAASYITGTSIRVDGGNATGF